MSNVCELLKEKNSQVYSIGRNATVLEAAKVMNEHRIGALVVLEDEQLIGIFTERDVLRRIIPTQRNPAETTVGEVMTTEIACCRSDTPIEEARAVFKNRRIRHLPVVDEERKVLGLISIGDLNAHDSGAQEVTIHFLQEYIYGRT